MSALKKLPGFQRAPAGLQWALRALQMIALAGTVLPVVGALVATHFLGADPTSAEFATTIQIVLSSALVLLWTVVVTVAPLCVIVLNFNGPRSTRLPWAEQQT